MFITNAMYERTKIIIVMGKSDPENPNRHMQQSQILVPKDSPGVTLVRPLTTFGYDDAPSGHAEVHFNNVRVPVENILLGEGRGFEIAQGRLGPGRFQYAMTNVGMAQRCLELMCARAEERVAFVQVKKLKLLSKPSKKGKSRGRAKKGVRLVVLEEKGDWMLVEDPARFARFWRSPNPIETAMSEAYGRPCRA